MLDGVPTWFEWKHVALLVVGWSLLTGGSFAIVLRVLLALPPEYFERERSPRASWTVARLARNAAGVALMAVGLALSVPGVPGQGALTVLTGLLLVDFPRRQRIERALARRPGVLPTLNRLRARFGRAPLHPPPPEDPAT